MQIRDVTILIILTVTSACIKDEVKLPSVITYPVTEINYDYAIAGGEVTDDGGSSVTSRGICVTINTSGTPTLADSWDTWHTNDGAGPGSFADTIRFVWAGSIHQFRQTHYICAYATNKSGTSYGEIITVMPRSKPPVFHSVKLEGLTATTASVSFTIGQPPEVFTVDEVDICIGTSPGPEISGTHYTIPVDKLSDGLKISNLIPNTTYCLRGYVLNESGFAYSPEISFTTWEGSVADIEGNIYQIKTIGNTVWMIQNLKVTKYNDGSVIPVVQDNLEWGSTGTGANCSYTNFGRLYNFYAVADSRKICPGGWHVPTDTEWKSLEMHLGMSAEQADATGFRGTDEGGKLKISGNDIDIWKYPNTGATNSSGFSAQGGGYRYDNGIFTNSTMSANFWTGSESDAGTAWSRSLSYSNAQISRLNLGKKYGFSLRCARD